MEMYSILNIENRCQLISPCIVLCNVGNNVNKSIHLYIDYNKHLCIFAVSD